MQSAEHRLVIPAELDGQRFDTALARLLNQYSRSLLKRCIDEGEATINGAIVKPRTAVQAGDQIWVRTTLDASDHVRPQAVPFDVVHHDDAVIVIDKPAGIVVHPGAGNREFTLVNGLVHRYPELTALPRAGLIHRIDKGTSGLLLVARNTDAYQSLTRAMFDRTIHRHYLAVCNGALIAGGTIEAPIGRDPRNRTRMWTVPNGRPSVTHYRIGERFRRHTLLDVTLETGRTHQIRVHLAAQGNVLVGDRQYGARPLLPPAASTKLREMLGRFPRPALHALSLTFAHPRTQRTETFQSAVPLDLETLLQHLRDDRDTHC